ncbi:MAG: hypothetical protein F4Y00_06335 [Bacteroidetes bacterium SB0662_bin_6]|nr:hypothetical protein [Bacteroidetes bacterium SB0668_bin_1]MYE04570.1 hypothetical protein [Bacteroidetes bacterium SB0662_bin_6]
MLIRSLASNYLKGLLRYPFGGLRLTGKILLLLLFWGPLFVPVTLSGVGVGMLVQSGEDFATVNRLVLYFAVVWTFVDLFLRGQIYAPIFPYLSTPIPRWKLISFYQFVTLFGALNLLLLAFVGAFWTRSFYVAYGAFAWLWLLSFLLMLLCVHVVSNMLRASWGKSYRSALFALLAVVALVVLEWGIGLGMLSGTSAILFGAALGGAFWPTGLLIALTGALSYVSTQRIARGLYVDAETKRASKARISRSTVSRSRLFDLVSLDWKLLTRNRRTRFSPVLVAAFTLWGMSYILAGPWRDGLNTEGAMGWGEFLGFAMAVSAVGLFYTGHIFSYRSAYYDGMQARPLSEILRVQGVLRMSHAGTLLGFAVAAPMIILSIRLGGIHPDMLLWAGCMFVYGLGVVNYAHVLAGMFQTVRIALNVNAFGAKKWGGRDRFSVIMIGVITWLPAGLLLFLMPDNNWAFMGIGAMGITGLLCHTRWVAFLVSTLRRRRYIMLERFRI